MLLACVQTDVAFADRSANLKTVIDRLEHAAEHQAELVVFPECMLCGYGFESREEAAAEAITLDDPVFTQLAKLAGRLNLSLTLGFLLKADERLFNATALITPQGLQTHYRKVHLPHVGADRFLDPGDLPYQVAPVPLTHTGSIGGEQHPKDSQDGASSAQVGMAICYDCSFPEPMRVLGLAGADVIALGTNWPDTAARTAEIVPPARSMENHLYFVAANRVGTERGFRYCGLSSICGPDGVVLAAAEGDEETVLFAEADLALARNKRIERTAGKHSIDRFADRRPDFYGALGAN